jgi:hypothetical protein
MLVMKSGEKPNLENYIVFFETLISFRGNHMNPNEINL